LDNLRNLFSSLLIAIIRSSVANAIPVRIMELYGAKEQTE